MTPKNLQTLTAKYVVRKDMAHATHRHTTQTQHTHMHTHSAENWQKMMSNI